MKIYIDATETQIGKIGSFAAKKALQGDEIFILNSEKAIISGNKENVVETIRNWRNKGGNSLKGPIVPKSPERLLKRMIRGMLPWDRTRGREAYKRIKCFKSNEFDSSKIGVISLKEKTPTKYLTLEEVVKLI